MKISVKVLSSQLTGLVLMASVSAANAEIAIIAHPSTKEIGVSKTTIADMFMGKTKTFRNGTRVKPVDQAKGSSIRSKFYKSVVRKSEAQVNRYWAKLKYTGKGKPPKEVSGDAAVKDWVASNPGAIGYIEGKHLDSSVKVVLIIP